MNVKKIIQRIVGDECIRTIKGSLKYVRKIPFLIKNGRYSISMEEVEKIENYELKNKNVFCGYYDLNPVKNKKILVHVTEKDDITSKSLIEIGYFDLDTKVYNKVTTTRAWCWQQGSRLSWSEKEQNVICFNDVEDNKYCYRKYDIVQEKVVDTIPFAIYDIDKEEKKGISLNFSRLQRLRPGYGYDVLPDETKGQNAPNNDGIFLVDMIDKTRKLLISLEELANMVDKEKKYEHYVNHVSISPNGKKVMFFHLWTEKKITGWRTQLCVMNMDGTELKILENIDVVSHYHWKDDDTILLTGIDHESKKNFYRYYYIRDEKQKNIEDSHLMRDGHPTHTEDGKAFYSDTYPDKDYRQTVFKYDLKDKKYVKLLDIFSDPRLVYEKRCDLHPKLLNEREISIDTTYKGHRRSVILIKIKDRN